MKIEYLLFNILVIIGPLVMTFEKNLNFRQYLPYIAPAIAIPLVPFIIWDSLVTGQHWHFNEAYTLDWRILSLPIEEWLFFITVPYSCLFIWKTLHYYLPQFFEKAVPSVESRLYAGVQYLLYAAAPAGIVVFSTGKEYTGLTLIFLAITALLDRASGIDLLRRRLTYLLLPIYALANLTSNGYLTARPVVIYGAEYQLDFRIITIPVEDFGYGAALVLMNIIIFEWLLLRQKITKATE